MDQQLPYQELFGKELRKYREYRRMFQIELARSLNPPRSQSYIVKLEKGWVKSIDEEVVKQLAEILNLPSFNREQLILISKGDHTARLALEGFVPLTIEEFAEEMGGRKQLEI